MRISKAHLSLTSNELIQQYCNPLFEHSRINHFEFDRYYFDGFGFNINSSGPGITELYLQEDLYPSLVEIDAYYSSSELAFITSEFVDNEALIDVKKWEKNIEISRAHHLNERFYIMSKTATYYDIFGFGILGCSQDSLLYHVEHVNLYKKFINYFKQIANQFITDCHKTRIKFCPAFLLGTDILPNQKGLDVLLRQSAKSPLIIDNVKITCAEERCLKLLTQGYSAKQAAAELGISPRTFEQHTSNLRQKFKCNNIQPIICRYIVERQNQFTT